MRPPSVWSLPDSCRCCGNSIKPHISELSNRISAPLNISLPKNCTFTLLTSEPCLSCLSHAMAEIPLPLTLDLYYHYQQADLSKITFVCILFINFPSFYFIPTFSIILFHTYMTLVYFISSFTFLTVCFMLTWSILTMYFDHINRSFSSPQRSSPTTPPLLFPFGRAQSPVYIT